MAGRREKLRRVGIIPEYRGFTPDGLASGDAIDMTVDELEVLRLCDLEGLNQEAVALHMGIARATVAAISSRAHRKVANALVNGRALVIEGGNIAYSPITTTTAAWPAKEVGTMRVATTYDNGNIFMHFGRSEQFKIYDIQDGKVLNEQVVGTGGTGHGALAGLLADGGVDTLICCGMDTNICVKHTVADAYFNNFNIIVVEDATATFLVGDQESGLDYMKTCYAAKIIDTDEAVRLIEG